MATGTKYKLALVPVAGLASCMEEGGAGVYVRQGWTGGDEVWERS